MAKWKRLVDSYTAKTYRSAAHNNKFIVDTFQSYTDAEKIHQSILRQPATNGSEVE